MSKDNRKQVVQLKQEIAELQLKYERALYVLNHQDEILKRDNINEEMKKLETRINQQRTININLNKELNRANIKLFSIMNAITKEQKESPPSETPEPNTTP